MTQSVDRILSYRISPRNAIFLANAMVLVTGVAELAFVPANVAIAAAYPAAVAACLWTRSIRILWITAAVSIVLALFVHRFAYRPPLADMDQVVWINRLAAVVTTLFVAVFVDRAIRTHTFAEGQVLSLGAKNTEMERLNREVARREEEIVRQNEELQSQTEELERQTEELRVTNEELASWERRLEQLLELARSLTAATPREDVFSKICEALGVLVESHATTLLVREGDQLVVQCYHGFGLEGPRTRSIPYSQSFSSQVMLLGQTGYVEDIRLRPDLQIPQPLHGPEFRAVLATPLRMDGQTIGTIEAYGPGTRAWNAPEVAVIESLAVQAGKSLQEAELMETIQLQRRRFEAALRTVPVGIVFSDDATGRMVRMNGAAAALFELASDENISIYSTAGARLAARMNPVWKADAGDQWPVSRALRGEEVYGAELEFRTQSGKRRVLSVSSVPILNEKQQIAGAVAAFVDVTEHRSLELELDLRRREAEEASLRKTRFLAAVSHDIRTPANAVNLMAEIISRLSTDPTRWSDIAEMAERLQANIRVLMDLIGDLLDVTRFDTGKMELTMSEFALDELLEQEANQVLPLARDKQLQLIVEPLSRPIWLRSDRVKLGRILGNLLGNAIKFTDAGIIRLSATIAADSRCVLLQVADSGIGISPEHQSTIFDEFSQLQNPARDRNKGAGLGLAICKRIVELLEGTISVRSAPTEGSVFTVELPASAIVLRTDSRPSTPVHRQSTPSTEPLNLRILLIEDHNVTRAGTAQLLREEGAVVEEAPNGKTGLDLLSAGRFDVALLDMMLPDLDGREILQAFKNERPTGLRGIVVLTGDLTEERVSEIKLLGGDALISKPVDVPNLMQLLHSFSRADHTS